MEDEGYAAAIDIDQEYQSCRNIIAAILLDAIYVRVYGGLFEKLDAMRYLDHPASLHYANMLGVNRWPPSDKRLNELRHEPEHYIQMGFGHKEIGVDYTEQILEVLETLPD